MLYFCRKSAKLSELPSRDREGAVVGMLIGRLVVAQTAEMPDERLLLPGMFSLAMRWAMRRLVLLCLLCAGFAQAQVITTLAGGDVIPLLAGPAVNAPLRSTSAVAVDGAGNIYIADVKDSIVARVSPDGILTVVAGNGRAGFSGDGAPATSGSLDSPVGVAVDSAENSTSLTPATAASGKCPAGGSPPWWVTEPLASPATGDLPPAHR